MTCSLILTLSSLFFLLPKGVILPAEGLVPSSVGPHSHTLQQRRDGLRFHAPAWIREQPSCHPPCALALCPSFPRFKHVTARQGIQKQVTGTKGDFLSGTLCWLERQRWPLATLPQPPVRLLCWHLVLCLAVLALLPQLLLPAPRKHPPPLKLQWNSHRN